MTTIDTLTLATELTNPDRNARAAAAMELGTRRDLSAAEAVVAQLAVEEDAFVRENLTWASVQLIEASLPLVIALLSSSDAGARRQAAHVLSKVGDPSLVPHLLGVIADADPEVAVKAYRAAASTGHPDVVAPLVARLAEGDGEQRDALTNALSRLGALAVPALTAALDDPDADVRAHAAEALGHLGAPDAVPAAAALAGLLADADAEVALAAVMALGSLGEEGEAPLQAVVASDGPLSGVAKRLLAGR